MIHPVIISIIVSSCIMGLLALGFTLQYITMKVPNLAYATTAFFSAYMPLTFWLFGVNPYLALALAFLLGAVLTLVLYKFLSFLQNRGLPPLGLMIATLAYDVIIYGILNIYADLLSHSTGTYARTFSLVTADFSLWGLPGIIYMVSIISIVMVILFHWLLTRTKLGIAMRAIVEDHALAATQGINTERVLMFSWFLVGGIAGIAGALWPFWYHADPWVGVRMLIRIFAACVVGGVYSIYGSLLGGIFIGGFEVLFIWLFANYIGTWITPFRTLIPISIAIIVLLILPKGIAGYIEKVRERRRET